MLAPYTSAAGCPVLLGVLALIFLKLILIRHYMQYLQLGVSAGAVVVGRWKKKTAIRKSVRDWKKTKLVRCKRTYSFIYNKVRVTVPYIAFYMHIR
jgi:hypothetical protein